MRYSIDVVILLEHRVGHTLSVTRLPEMLPVYAAEFLPYNC